MFDIQITTEPTTWPVTLTEVKTHLHLTDTDNDTQLTALLKQVTKEVEAFCGISIGEQVRVWTFDFTGGCEYPLPYNHVISVDEVALKTDYSTYEAQTANEDFDVDGLDKKTITVFNSGRFKVTYTAGITDTGVAVVPADLKLGILNEIAHRYENRGDTSTNGFSNDAFNLIIRHKDFSWE